MTEEFIKGILPDASAEVCASLLAEHGKTMQTSTASITALETERDGLKVQLETASGEIQSYKDLDIEGIKTRAAEWETKYKTETQALKDQMSALSYEQAVKEGVAGFKFSSESAKRAFVGDLTAKKLALQEGKLLGLDDFQKQYAASDPDAFAAEGSEHAPIFTRPVSTGTKPGTSGFAFNFSGVRAKPNKGE